MKYQIGTSILDSDLSNLADECDKLIQAGSDYLHLDVMDGHFVNNLTFGHGVIKCLKTKLPTSYFLDGHMMIEKPEDWINRMADAGVNQYTFHYEATDNVKGCIHKIQEAGMKVGLAISPKTNVEVLRNFEYVDTFLVMTVEPGLGGQSFMYEMLSKVEWIRYHFPEKSIEIDGGVNLNNFEVCLNSGADMLVCGSAITKSQNPSEIIKRLKEFQSLSIK